MQNNAPTLVILVIIILLIYRYALWATGYKWINGSVMFRMSLRCCAIRLILVLWKALSHNTPTKLAEPESGKLSTLLVIVIMTQAIDSFYTFTHILIFITHNSLCKFCQPVLFFNFIQPVLTFFKDDQILFLVSSIGYFFRSPLWWWWKMATLPLPAAILDDLICGTGNEVIQDGGRKRKGRHFPPPPQ